MNRCTDSVAAALALVKAAVARDREAHDALIDLVDPADLVHGLVALAAHIVEQGTHDPEGFLDRLQKGLIADEFGD
ncbi:hypothetical protein [Streptomyces sp. SP17KL33]|uniref:hypothetical protein n=1 Tax=Streptomyces sp. SP17KL33 TaxID=3002534 RepID=UPI002E783B12|nr:hypothetical protein [Streptomyces sp. SP17KL33]MEE1834914.1 hypothetical protein [Streptomyces sp. SP17KL33]